MGMNEDLQRQLIHDLPFLGTAETTINLDPTWAPVKVGATVAFRHVESEAATPAPRKAA